MRVARTPHDISLTRHMACQKPHSVLFNSGIAASFLPPKKLGYIAIPEEHYVIINTRGTTNDKRHTAATVCEAYNAS